MKVRVFVSSMAALLMAWLGVTYVQQVPWQAYPVLGRGGVPMAAKPKPKPAEPAEATRMAAAPQVAPASLAVVK